MQGAVIWTVLAGALAALALVPGKADVVGYAFAPVCAFCAWREWLAGVRVNEHGIKVVSFLFSKTIEWADIERFAVLPAGRYPYVGHVVRVGAQKPVAIWAMATRRAKTPEHRAEVQRPIDELNTQLAKWRARTA